MRLNVHYGAQRGGQLLEQQQRIYFEYDVGFLRSGIELSPVHLALRRGVFSHDDRLFLGLPGLFYDSLPDRRQLDADRWQARGDHH